MKTFGKFVNEYLEEGYLIEKNKPTSPEKWARAKAAAKSKFAVYPSAYANAWASKKYKAMGGGWKSVSEENELDENHIAIAMGKEMDDEGSMAMNQLDQIQRSCEMLRKEIKDPEMQLPGWVQSKITLAADYMETVAGYMASKNEKVSEEIELEEGAFSSGALKPSQKALDVISKIPSSGTVRGKDDKGVYTAKTVNGKEVSRSYEKPVKEEVELDETAAWQRKEGKNPSGGLNQKGVDSYRREHPGSKLKTAVTTKPSKLKPGSAAANRRKSFCARMSGMKKRLTSAKTARDPDSRINKSLRKWNC